MSLKMDYVSSRLIKTVSQSQLINGDNMSWHEESSQSRQALESKNDKWRLQSEIDEDFDSVSHSTQSCIQDLKKKKKKKEYKRRRRQKMKKDKENILEEARNILINIYQQKTNYQNQFTQLQQLFQLSIHQTHFYDLINDIIKQYVDNIKTQLWNNIQNTDWREPLTLETYFVKKLYEQFISLRKISKQAQKVINLFISQKRLSQNDYHKDLDCTTFNYMIKQDSHIKRLFFDACQRLLIDDNNQSKFQKEKNMLNNMIQVLDQEILTEFDFCEQDSLEQQQIEEKEKGKKKKNKKKKPKDYENESSLEIVMKRVQALQQSLKVNQEDRQTCNVHKDWIQKLENQINESKMFKKH